MLYSLQIQWSEKYIFFSEKQTDLLNDSKYTTAVNEHLESKKIRK